MRGKQNIFKVFLFVFIALYVVVANYLIISVDHGGLHEEMHGVSITLAVPAGLKTREVYRNKVKEFEVKHPEIKVKLLEISGNYYQKVLVMIAGNVAPDLMWMGQSFSEFADRGVFMDISERVEKSGIKLGDYKAEILNLYRRDGRFYSLPFGIDTSFIAYNRKLFRDAELEYPHDDWTFTEFLNAAQKLTRRDSSGRVLCYGFRGGLPIEVFGASIFDHGTGNVSCDTPEMINYFKTNLDLNYKYHVSPTLEEQVNMNTDNVGYFKQERVAMMLMFTMHWNRAIDVLKDMDWAITMSPKVKKQGQWASSQAMCIYHGTKNPDAVWELFKSFQEEDFMLAMSCQMIPAKMSVAKKMFKQTEDRPANFKVLAKIVGVLRPTLRVPHLQELESTFGRFSERIFARLTTPEEGMHDCAAEMKRRIEKFKINKQKDRK